MADPTLPSLRELELEELLRQREQQLLDLGVSVRRFWLGLPSVWDWDWIVTLVICRLKSMLFESSKMDVLVQPRRSRNKKLAGMRDLSLSLLWPS